MSEIKAAHIPGMSIGKIVDVLSFSYLSLIEKNIKFKEFPSVMLWGPPGVGKSQAVREIAEKIEKGSGKKVNVTDVRLLLFNPIDLRGIPTANEDKTLAIWLKPQIFQMDPSPDCVNILFLDEISAAPQSVQAAAYQITLDRVVGEHKLPDNCIVIAAGNRVTDKSVSFKMPKALSNRLMHIEAETNFESWKQWAVSKGINEKVMGYLAFSPKSLMNFGSSGDDLAYATPRTWELVSNVLNNVCDDVDKMYDLISGLIGSGSAVEFASWTKVYKDIPNVEDIFDGKKANVPKNTSTLYALSSSIVSCAKKHKDDLDKIANSIDYISKLPPDFSVLILKDYLYIEDNYKSKLNKIPEFGKWFSKIGSLLNAID